MKRPYLLPPDVNSEDEEMRYVRAAFPHFIFLRCTQAGHLLCACGVEVITPISYNNVTGRWEKMGIVPGCYGGHAKCPLCSLEFTVTRKQARKHNAYWETHDPDTSLRT